MSRTIYSRLRHSFSDATVLGYPAYFLNQVASVHCWIDPGISSTPSESPQRHYRRNPKARRPVKVIITRSHFCCVRLTYTLEAGNPECSLRVYDKPRWWDCRTQDQSICYKAGDWQRIVRRSSPRSGSIWEWICMATVCEMNAMLTICVFHRPSRSSLNHD